MIVSIIMSMRLVMAMTIVMLMMAVTVTVIMTVIVCMLIMVMILWACFRLLNAWAVCIWDLYCGMINAKRSAVVSDTAQNCVCITGLCGGDVCSQDRHARLDQPNVQVMNFCHSINLHSKQNNWFKTKWTFWPENFECDCEGKHQDTTLHLDSDLMWCSRWKRSNIKPWFWMNKVRTTTTKGQRQQAEKHLSSTAR